MADISKVRMLNGTEYNYKDAKARLDIEGLKADLANAGLSDAAKAALLACFRHIALWTDGTGEQYINTLESALSNDVYPQIRATFNSGAAVIYTDDTLASLKQYLTVKYYATAQSTGTVVSENNYTISGTLVAGTSVLTVAYNNLIAPVGIPNVIDFYNQYEWSLELGNLSMLKCAGTGGVSARPGNIWVNSISPGENAKKRRIFVTNRGKKPYIEYSNSQNTPYYPIPLPSGATQYTVSCNNSSYLIGVEVCKFDESNGIYVAPGTGAYANGFAASGYTKTFEPAENLFLCPTMKHDANNGNFDDSEPTNVTITFE